MTAYGRASKDTPLGRFVVEIHSVNRKFLDLNLSLPKDLLCFDIEIRKWLSEVLQRGQITVRITLQQEEFVGAPSIPFLKKAKESWEKAAAEVGFAPKEITLSFLLQQTPTFYSSDLKKEDDLVRKALKEGIDTALDELMAMKEKEAKVLVKDIKVHLGTIEECKDKIAKSAPESTENYRQKLLERMQEVLGPSVDSEERLLREMVIYAERIDCTEEITRLNSHVAQFYSLLKSDEKSVGRTLDFLTQEMNREINTLGAKCVGVEASKLVVAMKSALDKVREQIQNIE